MSDQSSNTVTLPPGVTVSPGRESVQTGLNNQSVQGMIFTLTLVNGATTSVFIPYAIMHQVDVVSDLFAKRVAALNGVTNLST